ncbi:MAG: hypothetical protein ACPGNV_12340 [Mangrovicoccus sp.]
MLARIAEFFRAKTEQRPAETALDLDLDYVRHIAQTDEPLLQRYGRISDFLDPNTQVPPLAYHAARITAAFATDCSICLSAEINLARKAGIPQEQITQILNFDDEALPFEISAVIYLARAVIAENSDNPEARDYIRQIYGEAGLIELSYAMGGAAMLPTIRRVMGFGEEGEQGDFGGLELGEGF